MQDKKSYSLRSQQSMEAEEDDGGDFQFFNQTPMHGLKQSVKRGVYTNEITGDKLLTQESLKSFKPFELQNEDQELMEKRMDSLKNGQFGVFEKKDPETNQQYKLYMMKVQAFGSDRSMNTSLGGDVGQRNDGSHGFPLNLSLNPGQVDKQSYIFPESFMSNQGGAREMERRAENEFKKPVPRGRQKDVFYMTETRTNQGEEIPNQIRRASISVERDKRTQTVKKMTVQGLSGHDNDQSFKRKKF